MKRLAILSLAVVLCAIPATLSAASTVKVGPALSQDKQIEATTEMFTGIGGECHVDSRVNAYIRVYINGVYRGTMAPFGDIYPFVGDSAGSTTYLYAESTDGRSWSRTVSGNVSDFTWTLVP